MPCFLFLFFFLFFGSQVETCFLTTVNVIRKRVGYGNEPPILHVKWHFQDHMKALLIFNPTFYVRATECFVFSLTFLKFFLCDQCHGESQGQTGHDTYQKLTNMIKSLCGFIRLVLLDDQMRDKARERNLFVTSRRHTFWTPRFHAQHLGYKHDQPEFGAIILQS